MGIGFKIENMDGLQDTVELMEEKGAELALKGAHNWLDYSYEVAIQEAPSGSTGLLVELSEVVKKKWGGIIRFFAPYAGAVHDGYIRHPIPLKHRKALRWESKDGKFKGKLDRLNRKGSRKDIKWFFSKGHFVPGRKQRSKPNPWMTRTLEKTKKFLSDFIIDAMAPIFGGG